MIFHNPFLGMCILVLSLLLAAFIGAMAGILFILPSAKLKNEYLSIALLAMSEVLYQVSNRGLLWRKRS